MNYFNFAPVRKYLLPGILLIAVAACSAGPARPALVTAVPTVVPPTDIPPVLEPTGTAFPPKACDPDGARKICIRWTITAGIGTDPSQIAVEQKVVEDFNASQDKITLVLEGSPFDELDAHRTQISAGNAPDIVGPVSWDTSNALHGQWLDLSEQIAASGFDTGIFDPGLVQYYRTDEGQIGLPLDVYPGAVYYVPAMFDAAGLDYPPQKYGEKYKLDDKLVEWDWQTVTQVARRLTLDDHGQNATQQGFDRSHIIQFGYTPQWQLPLGLATFYAGAAKVYEGKAQGEYKAAFPDGWKEAWQWYYDGIWGAQPFIPSSAQTNLAKFGAGNAFNSGKIAMGLTQTWYTCCLGDFAKAGNQFQLGIQPMGADGQVHGRVDADSFRIWKGSKHPAEAFQVYRYLITVGADKLLPAYGAMPAIASKADLFLAKKKADYPFVIDASWDVFVQGLAYPDIPSAFQYQPNPVQANNREQAFMDLMNTTPPDKFDFEAAFKKLVDDLNIIYNR